MQSNASAAADPLITLTFAQRRPVPSKALSSLHLALMMNVDSRLELLHDFGLDKPVAIAHPDRFDEIAKTGLATHLLVFTGKGAECCAYLVESEDGSLYECLLGNGQTVRRAIQAFRDSDPAARVAGKAFVGSGLDSLLCNYDGVFAGLTVDGFRIYAPHARDESAMEYLDVAGMTFVEIIELDEIFTTSLES